MVGMFTLATPPIINYVCTVDTQSTTRDGRQMSDIVHALMLPMPVFWLATSPQQYSKVGYRYCKFRLCNQLIACNKFIFSSHYCRKKPQCLVFCNFNTQSDKQITWLSNMTFLLGRYPKLGQEEIWRKKKKHSQGSKETL